MYGLYIICWKYNFFILNVVFIHRENIDDITAQLARKKIPEFEKGGTSAFGDSIL